MIPKIIHYCWFGGGEKPEPVKKCIESWKKCCPDFDIVEWNEHNFDISIMPFTAEAYEVKKYAFVSDVARLFAVYKNGGVYLDTDVELIGNISPLLCDRGIMGFENEKYVASGLMIAAEAGHPVIQAMIDEYKPLHFYDSEGKLTPVGCPEINTLVMERFGMRRDGSEQFIEGIHVYPAEYFNPMDSLTGRITVTENTYSIHRYSQSWLPAHRRLRTHIGRVVRRILGVKKG